MYQIGKNNHGVVKRVFRTINTAAGACPNVMFLELYPAALLNLTYPKDDSDSSTKTDISENENTSLQNCQEVFTKKETYSSQNGNTNTENTTETTTEISTTTLVPAEPPVADVFQKTKELFAEYQFTDDDIESLLYEAKDDYEKCHNAYLCLKQQHGTINNRIGWLRKAIRRGYQPKYTPDQEAKSVQNSFHNFKQRNYDWDVLERKLLGFS